MGTFIFYTKITIARDPSISLGWIVDIVEAYEFIDSTIKPLWSYLLNWVTFHIPSGAFFFPTFWTYSASWYQVLHCKRAHTRLPAKMRRYVHCLWIYLLKIRWRAETRSMSSHKRLLPLSNCHLKQLMFGENLPRWSGGRFGSDSQILIYYFGSSLFLMITGKVKIGIEKFKGSKRTYLHISSTALQSKNTSPKMERASIWETFECLLRELGWSLYLVWYMYFYWSVPLITMHRWVPVWPLRPLSGE